MHRSITTSLAAALALAAPLAAQTADLRWAAPEAVAQAYATVDSMTMTTSMGAMGTTGVTGVTNSVVHLEFTQAGDSVSARGTLRQLSGTLAVSTPMGEMPMPMPAPDAEIVLTLMLGPQGLAPDADVPGGMPDFLSPGASADLIARSRITVLLAYLPGHSLRAGESWEHSGPIDAEVEGMRIGGSTEMRGTYQRDTVVAGRTYNLVDIAATMRMTMSGSVQGRQMEQPMQMSNTSTTLLLWDPARRVPFMLDTHTDMTMNATAAGMDMETTGRTRTITRQVDP
jgi:hypothetical protein